MPYDIDKEIDFDLETERFAKMAKETTLELIENDQGQLLLRETGSSDDALMTIDFSDKLKELLGTDTHAIGQHMIQAAIQVIMQKQISRWHAQVYDQEPTRYS